MSMVLSFFVVLILIGRFVIGGEIKKHVSNSVYPYNLDPPSYNIESWVKQLHLQQCALVEVGDKYYAIFVESRPRRFDREKGIKEYFLGLCDDDTLNKWSFCSANLQLKRAEDCNFYSRNMYNTRVHRRLCDLTLLAMNAPQCDCNTELLDAKLYKVQGFPTCFKPPLPTSLCGDNNVCGLAGCSPRTINKRVHSIKCDRKCNENQPFCEPCDKRSSLPRQIKSFWTDWSNPYCTDSGCISQFDEAICINRETGRGDIDCLGPGTSCCAPELQNCKCHVYEENGVTKVFRTFSIPQPEQPEYMSEEDFINNIPLHYMKDEFHKYPEYLLRPVRANFGKSLKQTLVNIYDSFPFKFGNIHKQRKALKKFKSAFIKPYSTKKSSDSNNVQEITFKPSTNMLTTTSMDTSSTPSIINTSSKEPTIPFITMELTPDTTSPGIESSLSYPAITSISTSETSFVSFADLTDLKSTESSTSRTSSSPVSVEIDLHGSLPSTSSTSSTSPPSQPVTQKEAEKKVSILKEVNASPMDTFTSVSPVLKPEECVPCKKRHIPFIKPEVNTNGIHRKSRIHHKSCKYNHNHLADCGFKKRKERNLIKLLYHNQKKYKTVGRTKLKRLVRSQFQRNMVHEPRKSTEDVEIYPWNAALDNSEILLDNVTEAIKRCFGILPRDKTLRKKLSFDLIFDDSKVPSETHSRNYQRRPYTRRFLVKPPVKRQFFPKFNRATYEEISPKLIIPLNGGRLDPPTDLLGDHRQLNSHIERHFYARTRDPYVKEEIPQFGYYLKTTYSQTTTRKKEQFHSEMEDEDFITDENGMWITTSKIGLSTQSTQMFQGGFWVEMRTKRMGHPIRNEFECEKSSTYSSVEKAPSSSTIAVSNHDNPCNIHPIISHTDIDIHEDDEEDALVLEEKLDQLADELEENENDIENKSKRTEDNSKTDKCLSYSTTQICRRSNSDDVIPSILEDEDEHWHTDFNRHTPASPANVDQPDTLEDEDLTHTVEKPLNHDKRLDLTHGYIDFETIDTNRLKLSGVVKRYSKVSSEEISDDEDLTYAEDDDVALEYDAEEQEEILTTTEYNKEIGEDKSINAKVEIEEKSKNNEPNREVQKTSNKASERNVFLVTYFIFTIILIYTT